MNECMNECMNKCMNKCINPYMNQNILMIGYCHLADGFLGGARAFEKMGFTITFFPYYSYIMDKREDKETDIISIIKDKNINICLWWCNAVSESSCSFIMNHLKEHAINVIHIFYNFDPFLYEYEKYNSFFWKPLIENKKEVYPCMNYIFTCFEKEIQYFSSLPIYYAPPGFDTSISFYEENKDFECDISIVCTTLYDSFEEHPFDAVSLSRWEVVHTLYTNRHLYTFHIYGPEKFKTLFPECYRGFISYNDSRKVFSNSKINLSIHTLTKELHKDYSTSEYFSERVPQILGCRGLLATNSFLSHLLKPNRDYIFLDENWFSSILNIIQSSMKYDIIRNNGYKIASQYYTWNNWSNSIIQMIPSLHEK